MALKQGNYWIGTGDVEKGPTSTTDYWNGITPSSGGYTIYLNKASNGPSIYVAANDSALISLTNTIAGASYTTVAQCFNYFRTQTDKMIFNRDYEPIITNGLVLWVDAGFRPSYTTSGTSWYDISSNADILNLTNGPSFSGGNNGYINFDGTDDYVISTSTTNTNVTSTTGFTFGAWVYPEFTANDFNNTQIQAIICSRAFSTNNFDYFIALGLAWGAFGCAGNSRNLFYSYQGNNSNTCSDGTNVWTNNAWNYIVSTHLGTSLNQYVNGVAVTTNKATFNVTSSTSPKYIFGQGASSVQTRFKGRIAINHVYNRALSATEVLQNFNAQKARFGL